MTLEVALRARRGDFVVQAAFSAGVPGATVLFGPSGAGKSSVLAAVAGLLAAEGHVRLGTEDLNALPAERRRVGVVFQDARLFPHLHVEANLRFGQRRAPPGPIGFDAVVDLLGIRALLRRRPRDLSGGERQRVALGRALLSQPRLLALDEPLASLDQPRRSAILPFLEHARDALRIPLLHVTHDWEEAVRLADTVVLMEGGGVLATGSPMELAARADLPLVRREDAGAVVDCMVAAHDTRRGRTRLDFPGGSLTVPLRGEPVGSRLRARIPARGVAVARAPAPATSLDNALPAAVRAVLPDGPHGALIMLAVGPLILMARAPRDALAGLGLEPGMDCVALLHAVRVAGGVAADHV
jgi:molybdate transport system ATP-binding protein